MIWGSAVHLLLCVWTNWKRLLEESSLCITMNRRIRSSQALCVLCISSQSQPLAMGYNSINRFLQKPKPNHAKWWKGLNPNPYQADNQLGPIGSDFWPNWASNTWPGNVGSKPVHRVNSFSFINMCSVVEDDRNQTKMYHLRFQVMCQCGNVFNCCGPHCS